MDGTVVLLFLFTVIFLAGAEVRMSAEESNTPIIAEVVPKRVEKINGSTSTMGCNNSLVSVGKLTVCGTGTAAARFQSYLSDRCVPQINTNEENWASNLLTVKKSLKSDVHDFEHVLLTFAYEIPVIPDSIKLDLFLCPEWHIGAPYITLFGDNNSDMVYRGFYDSDFIIHHLPSETSCDNLSSVNFTLEKQEPLYYNWHILVSFIPDPNIEWVFIGEVTFINIELHPDPPSSHTFDGTPITTDTINGRMSSSHTTTSNFPAIHTTTTKPFMTMTSSIQQTLQQTPTTSLIPATTLTSLVSTKSVITSTPVYTAPTKVTTTQAWIKQSISVTHITSLPVSFESTMAITPTTNTSLIPSTIISQSTPESSTPAISMPLSTTVNSTTLGTRTNILSLSKTANHSMPQSTQLSSISTTNFMPKTSSERIPPSNTLNGSPRTTIAKETSTSAYVVSETFSSVSLESSDVLIPTPIKTVTTYFMPKTSSERIPPSNTLNESPRTTIAKETSTSAYVVSETFSSVSLESSDVLIPTPIKTVTTYFMPKTSSERIPPSNTLNESPRTTIAKETSTSAYVVSETFSSVSLESSDVLIPTPIKTVTTYSVEITQSTNSSTPINNLTKTPTISLAINSPTGNRFSDENTSTPILPIVVVSVLCLLVLFVLISVIVIGFIFSRHHRIRNRREVQAGYEPLIRVPNPTSTEHTISEQNFVVNPIYQPLYSILGGTRGSSSRGAPMFFNLYKDVNPDTLSPRITPDSEEDDEEDDATSETIQSRLINVESHDTDIQHRGRMPTPSHDVEDEDTHSASVYSLVQVRKAPVVPPKSSALLQYLAQSSNLNIDIYTEPIRPSDFTYGGSHNMEDGESDHLICAPIYPSTLSCEQYEEPEEITSESFMAISEVGIGQFGNVFLVVTTIKGEQMARLSTTLKQGSLIFAAVKKLKPNLSPSEQEAFEKEVKFISQLRHPNVLRFLGVCYQDPAFIMIEYTEEGDLNQFLQRYSEIVSINIPSNSNQISTCTLIYMASQIANAMQHCAALKFVHRDLATRNCYVGKNFTVKVAAVGIHARLYRSHYFQISGNRLFPIRWMATECFSGRFSEKSDVWAFGVTMWELFTLANKVPYPHLSDEEVIQNALSREFNQLPSKPATCPQTVYEIMQQCWIIDFQQRATFREINVMLQTST